MILSNEQAEQIKANPQFHAEFMVVLEAFRQGGGHKETIASIVEQLATLREACSCTWLTYYFCNCTEDESLNGDYLSEIVVEIEDLVDDIKIIVEKYKKSL